MKLTILMIAAVMPLAACILVPVDGPDQGGQPAYGGEREHDRDHGRGDDREHRRDHCDHEGHCGDREHHD